MAVRSGVEIMEEKYVLTVGEGSEKTEYLIERVIRHREKLFFTLFNLGTGDMMFGEYGGELPEDEDLAREIIWNDFREGCRHISYPDGYIVDELFDMTDFF